MPEAGRIKRRPLASYAKQAGDNTLHHMATRIQGRAIRREGELLEQIEAGQGARDGKRREGDHPPFNRTQVATGAGLSDHQRKTALRVANIPVDEFESAIEGDVPPTVTELARRGTVSKPKPIVDLGTRTPEQFQAATGLIGAIDLLCRYSSKADLPLAIAGLNPRERCELRQSVHLTFQWLTNLLEAFQ